MSNVTRYLVCRSLSLSTILVSAILCLAGGTLAEEISPPISTAEGTVFSSDRTITLGLEVDRDHARLIAFTVKERPFSRAEEVAESMPYQERVSAQIEIILLGPDNQRYTQRVQLNGICLAHPAEAEPHIEGDTFWLHREGFLVEVPELDGFDRVEIAFYAGPLDGLVRHKIGLETLDSERFSPAGARASYSDLLFADPEWIDPGYAPTGGERGSDVFWPEDFGDPDIYRVYGNESEIDQRVNIVLVPDGYTYAEKVLMESHAQELVDFYRTESPFAELDLFFNYILVYAYSLESGTDECDCDIILNTAMGTRFPESNPICGHSDNRCLSYGYGCDTPGTGNIVTAEMRAPAHDETVVMVNTTRYGGCGGSRATYAAGNSSAQPLATHEMGHSYGGLADEYTSYSDCGTYGGEVNCSTNPTEGAWPEWIDDLGSPWEGARYYTECIYRPVSTCMMRSLGSPFCAVCRQHVSLVTFGHPNVDPTAPIEASKPDPTTVLYVESGEQVDFGILTRLPTGNDNQINWSVEGPFMPRVLPSAPEQYSVVFQCDGNYMVSVEVVAAMEMIKPERYGANVDTVLWTVNVSSNPSVTCPVVLDALAYP